MHDGFYGLGPLFLFKLIRVKSIHTNLYFVFTRELSCELYWRIKWTVLLHGDEVVHVQNVRELKKKKCVYFVDCVRIHEMNKLEVCTNDECQLFASGDIFMFTSPEVGMYYA